jgi:hypothetical protein
VYACELWDVCLPRNADKLDQLQLEATRIITGLPKFASKDLNDILVPYIIKNFSDYNCYQLNIYLDSRLNI